MTLIYFILILGITVTIHEFGHFIFAKKAGIYVYEFSIGMGPLLWKFNRKNDETTYCIRLLPIGGYVQMSGEEIEEDEKIPKEKRMQSKPWIARFLTVIAGVTFNFLLALVVLFIVGIFSGYQNPKPIVTNIYENSPVSKAGLQVNDEIVKVNGRKANTLDRLKKSFTEQISSLTREIEELQSNNSILIDNLKIDYDKKMEQLNNEHIEQINQIKEDKNLTIHRSKDFLNEYKIEDLKFDNK